MVTAAQPTSFFGRAFGNRQVMLEGLRITFYSILISVAYAVFMHFAFPAAAPHVIDFVGTFTGLACVWLTRKENMWAWPTGIISVIFMGIFFVHIGLMGQAWLQLAYYFPIQWWGWYQWMYGGQNKSILKVSFLQNKTRLIYLVLIVLFTIGFGYILHSGYSHAIFTYWDASIVAASVLAQILLSLKKVESWALWIVPVNISAIALYSVSGAYMFAVLYVIYLWNASYGIREWIVSYNENRHSGARVHG